MRPFALRIVSLLIAAAPVCAVAAGPEPIGSVRTASGSAFLVRGASQVPAVIGALVYASDGLRTGHDGTLGVTFRDDTRLALGRDTEVRVDELSFAPAQGRIGAVFRMLRGVVAYVSGKIARIAPESIRFETPVATLGIRGTEFAALVEPAGSP